MINKMFWLGRLLTFMALALFTGIMGCEKASSPKPVPTLRIGHAPHDHHSPLYIAAMNPEYFRNNGGTYMKEVKFGKKYDLLKDDQIIAKVEIDSSTGGKKLVRKLAEEHFDMSFGGMPAFLKFIDNGYMLKIVAPTMAEGAGLVVGKDSPINNWEDFVAHLQNPDNKKPFRIGFKINISVQNLIFESALNHLGIPYSKNLDDKDAKVVLINLHGAKNLIPALESGLIDGFVVMQPFLAMAEHKSVGKTIAMLHELPPEGRWEGNACCALAANMNYLKANKELSEQFVTLLMRANRFIIQNPDKSAEQIAKWLGIASSVEKSSIPTIKFTNEFNEQWNNGVDFWVDSMVKNKILNGTIKESFKASKHRELIYDLELYERSKSRL